jgi:beta-lactam-binding protein with PASTA domain
MATRVDLPLDVVAALDRVPGARERFFALPAEQQADWLSWIDRSRSRSGRAARVDDMIQRLAPSGVTAEEQVVEPAAPRPERYWWLWLLLLLLLVVGGLLAWYFLTRGSDKATVPNVIGLRSDAAAARIHEKGLDVSPRTGASDRPPDVVFAERPGPGTQLGKGQTVTILISSGRRTVPDVTGLPLAQAQTQLTSAGLEVEIKRVASSRAKGIVVGQEPVAGVTAANGTTVKLSVSSGAIPVEVPRVVGKSQGDAVAALTKLELRPALHNVPSAQPAGTVVGQKPPAGNEVDQGSTVTVNVSTGSASSTTTSTGVTTAPTPTVTTPTAGSVRVPRIVALAQTPALRRLNVLGLRPAVVYVASSEPANRVIGQSPGEGTSLRKGSRVRVRVSAGPNPQPATSVPNVVGQDQATAADTLRTAGFKVAVLNRPTSDQSRDGVVVEQQPRAGASIPGGVQVTIFVGRLTG